MTTGVPVLPWTFLDYVEANGNNQVSAWLGGIPQGARGEFEALLDTIKPLQRLDRPQTGVLLGECEGLYEFVITHGKVQYRPLFVYGPRPREITILAGATKTGGIGRTTPTKWDPPNVCATAKRRQRNLNSGLARTV
jgi:hypothetical protein